MGCLGKRAVALVAVAAVGSTMAGVWHHARAESRYTQGISYSQVKKETKLLPKQERERRQLDDTPLLPALKGIVIVDSPDKVKAAGVDVQGVQVRSDAVPQEVVNAARAHVGKPVSLASLDRLTRDLVLAFRRAGMPVVNVVIPPQDITGGTVQIVAVIGRMGQLSVSGNAANPDYYTSDWPLARGDVIEEGAVLDHLRWKSRRFFRQVNAIYAPGSRFSETDVTLDVRETKPWMVFAGADNTGQRNSIGEYRLFAGFMVGDLWGLDHELSYQFTTSEEFVDNLAAHVLSYTLPVVGRTDLKLMGSYVKSRNDALATGTSRGKSYQISAEFLTQLPRMAGISWDVRYGFEYKNSDNDFDFGGTNVSTTRTELGQFHVQLLGQHSGARTRTNFHAGVWFSPGGMFGNHSDEAFHRMRANASADYVYVRAGVEQAFFLPQGLQLNVELTGQLSSKRLLSSEMMYLGGLNSVRGFDENAVRGDNGILGRIELYLPSISLLKGNAVGLRDSLRFFGFLDFGAVDVVGDPSTTEGNGKAFIAGAGVGLAYQVSENFTAELAYGWKLDEDELTRASDAKAGRIHFRVIARY